jgi:biopolymer transport protein ExbD
MRRRLFPSLDEGEGEEPLINLTPLIDVVFVLLITFMLLAPILHVDHVDLAQSGSFAQKNQEGSSFAIVLRKDNTIWVNGSLVEMPLLKSLMQSQKKRFPDLCPQMLADKSCHFGLYQDVKNMLEECGFQALDVVLQ